MSLIGIILRLGFLIWELIFIYCRLFVLILVVFVLFLLSQRFGQISPPAFFRWFTATSDRNAESCNRIPSNYCLPLLLSIAPRFWPSKRLADLGRIWNRYLLTMLTWNRRDSTPLSAAPNKTKKSILDHPSVKTVPFQTIQFSISKQFKPKYGLIVNNISISSYSV